MINQVNLNNDTIFVSVRAKGVTFTLPLNQELRHSARIKEPALVIYQDGKLSEKVSEVRNFLFALSKSSLVTPPSSSTFAVPSNLIDKLKNKLDQVDAEVERDLQEIIDNYDDVKNSNLVEVKKAIENMPEKEQKKILARFNLRYPSVAEIKAKRGLLISIMASPLAGEIKNLELLKDRVEEDVQLRYKEAVFAALDPIYKAAGTYYTKLSNNLEIGNKSKNYFDDLVYDLKEQNLIRRDGFTEQLLEVISKYKDEIFEDGIICYNLVLNIYKEASTCDVEGTLTNLEKLERRILKDATSAKFLLETSTIDEELESALTLKDLLV